MELSLRSFVTVIIFILGFSMTALPVQGPAPSPLQDRQIDVDDLFRRALELGREGKFEEARKLCRSVLEKAPEYHDVRVYLARLFLWQRTYDPARSELIYVVDRVPDHVDALNALIDTELWSDHPEAALRYCNQGLKYHPRNRDFLWKSVRIHYLERRYPEAAAAIRRLLEIDPQHAEALQLYRLIQYSTPVFSLAQTYRIEFLGRRSLDLKPWHFFGLDATYHTGWGTMIGRLSLANRDYGDGGLTGAQLELESYPIFSERFYAHLNIGFSSADIFPRYRLGGEFYANLPQAFELSAGLRYMDYPGSHAYVLTGTLGKYYRDYWISFRPSFSSESAGSAFSGLLWVRRYFRSGDEYIGALAGIGTTPVDMFFLEDIRRYSSFRIGLEIKRPLSRLLVIRGHLRYEREEYRPDVFGNRFVIDLRLEERLYRKY